MILIVLLKTNQRSCSSFWGSNFHFARKWVPLKFWLISGLLKRKNFRLRNLRPSVLWSPLNGRTNHKELWSKVTQSSFFSFRWPCAKERSLRMTMNLKLQINHIPRYFDHFDQHRRSVARSFRRGYKRMLFGRDWLFEFYNQCLIRACVQWQWIRCRSWNILVPWAEPLE